ARWCNSLRLVGRPFGTPGPADDFDPVVFGVQFARRALADVHLPVRDPGAAGHRDGGGVASRRGAGDGILAGPLTWTDVGSVAGIMGARVCLVRAGIRLPVRSARSLASGLWLARYAYPRRVAGFGLRLDQDLRERARGLDGKQADPERDPSSGNAAAVRHLQAQIFVQHVDSLPMDGHEFLRLLRSLGHAWHLSAERVG